MLVRPNCGVGVGTIISDRPGHLDAHAKLQTVKVLHFQRLRSVALFPHPTSSFLVWYLSQLRSLHHLGVIRCIEKFSSAPLRRRQSDFLGVRDEARLLRREHRLHLVTRSHQVPPRLQ